MEQQQGQVNEHADQNMENVVFMHSDEFVNVCADLPKVRNRALMVQKLLEAYDLLKKMRLEKPCFATKKMLSSFHCTTYIDCLEAIQNNLKKMTMNKDDEEVELDKLDLVIPDLEEHGVGYDCAPFQRIFHFVCMVSGATIKCAEMLNAGDTRLAVNLYGGWHHAHRDEAAGFCYVNDIVLGILKLREKFNKILYIDLDIHHGDGVEEAFASTDKVMTVSFHKHQDGYFPGTGSLYDVGKGRGKYHTVNVPLKEGINDDQYYDIFTRIIGKVKDAFQPEVVVCQFGADGLTGDPLGGFNLTGKCMSKCVDYIKNWKFPMMVLGGGGYNFANTAKCWTQLIATVLDVEISNNIPDHEYFDQYAPLFEMNVIPSVRKSSNTEEYLQYIISTITENMENLAKQNKKNAAKTRARHFGSKNPMERKIARLANSSPTKENKPIRTEEHETQKISGIVADAGESLQPKTKDLNNNNNNNNNSEIRVEDMNLTSRDPSLLSRDMNEQSSYLRPSKVFIKYRKLNCQSFDFDEDMF